MRDRLLKLLGIDSGEESMVSMLLAQSVFLGIFFGAFDISAHSLFLSIFDEKMMARGYVVSGLAGIILTSLYTTLQTRMRFRGFAILNLAFVTAFTLLLWILLLLNPAKWVIFLVFIMLGPLNILAMLGFWGTTGRLFTLRQGKRLFGLIDAGMVAGIILSCYAIPVLLTFSFESHDILIISAFAVMSGTLLQIIIGKKFQLTSVREEKPKEEEQNKRSLLKLVRSDSYIRVMAIFIALSVMTAFFVQYSFMAVTREQYPSEADMARFLGLFTGSMMIFTLLIKLLVFSYLIRNYGLKTCLAISPILVAAFTLIAILIGMLMGFTPAASGFMLFFMLLAMSRLFTKALKDSIESPSFKVIYQTIDEKVRFGVQSAMDGTVNEIAALASGLLLAGLGILSFIRLIHFSWVLLLITVIWIFYAVWLYAEYRKSIRKALESGTESTTDDLVQRKDDETGSRFLSELAFADNYLSMISGDLTCLEQHRNRNFFETVLDHSEERKDLSLIPALNRMASDKEADEDIRHRSLNLADELMRWSADTRNEDKLFIARKILADSRQPQTTQILRLLRDNNPESRELAMMMIGKFRLKDMLTEVCDCLNVRGLEVQAANVLQSFGDEAREELTRFFMVSSGNSTVSRKILEIIGKSGSAENNEFLYSGLWSNSRLLREAALEKLIEHNYRVSDEERDRFFQMISEVIGIIAWNISARVSISRHNNDLLLSALNSETTRWNSFLFRLMSIVYDSGSIHKIRENLESGTVESVNFALEMLDIVVDEALKPKLVPLLDVIPDEDKVKALFQFYPGEVPEYERLIEDIINRDYNLLGIWIRVCAIRSLEEIKGTNLSESLVALLFSPEKILQEESARLFSKYGIDTYRAASLRLPAAVRRRLDEIVNGERPDGDMLREKVKFLSECFQGLSEEDLLIPAESIIRFKDIQPEGPDIPEGFIMWKVIDGKPGKEVRITTGSQGKKEHEAFVSDCDFIYLLPLNSVKEYNFKFPGKSAKMLEYIETNE